MCINKFKLILLSCLSYLLIVSPSTAVTIEKIVAVVNGEIITFSEVQELEYSLRAQGIEQKEKTPDLTRKLLDKLVDKKLQLQLAYKKKITVSDQQLKEAVEDIKRQNGLKTDEQFKEALAYQGITLENFTEQLKENLRITILTRREVLGKIEIKEEEVLKYHQEHKEDFSYLDELRAQHILLYLPAEITDKQISAKKELAQEILEKLRVGEDFAKLAQEHSDDPSAKKGGDLGFFHQGEMLPALEKAAAALEIGEISSVIRTNLGFHIIKLTEQRQYTPENNPKLKQRIEDTLYQQQSDTKLKKWLKKLRKEAKIKIML